MDTVQTDREWRLIPEEPRQGAMQMALDEVAAETVAAGGPATVRVYRWRPSTLSLGYHQDPATIDWAFCDQTGIDVVRRPTGGGAIYHDSHGDLSYSIVAPADELPGELLACYELLCTPVLDAFDRLGVSVAFASEDEPAAHAPACYLRGLHPAHDIVTSDGRKISGNAQHRTREAVVQHGSLKYELVVDRHLGCFAADLPPELLPDRVAAVGEYVEADRAAMVTALERALADWAGASVGSWTDAELDRATELVETRFGTEAWTRTRGRPDQAR